VHDPQTGVTEAESGLGRLGQPWAPFTLTRPREASGMPRSPHNVEEVERLRDAERRIASTTGWNSSTMVIGRLLQRLRSDHCDK
jgi:hypothetical protein